MSSGTIPLRLPFPRAGDDNRSENTQKAIRRGSFSSVTQLKEKILHFTDHYNNSGTQPFLWTATAELPRYDGHLSIGFNQGGESWREEDEGGIRPSTRSGS